MACKQLGLITNLAPFDTDKAKKCTFAIAIACQCT